MKQLLIALLSFLPYLLYAQEFPKRPVLYLESIQGISTNFTAAADTYTGSLQLTPQFAIVPGQLRIGATGGISFNNKKLFATIGPNLALRLATFNINPFGSLANLQAQLQHLWGTGKQKLFGGGIKAEVGQIILIGITAHRDYYFNYWWFQTSLGFNLLHEKRKKQPDDPFTQR